MSNPHSKTPGGQAASDKFLKQQAQAHGEGQTASSNTHIPGDAPVASDSGRTNVGIDNNATNVPGQKGENMTGMSVSTSSTTNEGLQK